MYFSHRSTPRKTAVKEVLVPLAEVTLTKGGREIQVALWREAALQSLAVGDWIKVTHLRGSNHPDYGFKLHSTANTEISVSFLFLWSPLVLNFYAQSLAVNSYALTGPLQCCNWEHSLSRSQLQSITDPTAIVVSFPQKTEACPSICECVIEGIMEGPDFYTLLRAGGSDLRVKAAEWRGTTEDFIERLPLSVSVEVDGDIIRNPKKLFEVGGTNESIHYSHLWKN